MTARNWRCRALRGGLVLPWFLVTGVAMGERGDGADDRPVAPWRCAYEIAYVVPRPGDCGLVSGGTIWPVDMNDDGWVVGYVRYCVTSLNVPFIWTPQDGFREIPGPDGSANTFMESRGINNHGQVVGVYFSGVDRPGWVYDATTDVTTDIWPYPDSTGTIFSDINDHGDIAGHRREWVEEAEQYVWIGFVRKADGTVVDIGHAGAPYWHTNARFIGAGGDVTGRIGFPLDGHSYFFSNGQLVPFDDPDPFDAVELWQSNSSGKIAGWIRPDGEKQHFALLDGDRWISWPPPRESVAGGGLGWINDFGEALGTYTQEPGGIANRRTVLLSGGEIRRLDDLLTLPEGTVLRAGRAINRDGWFLVSGEAEGRSAFFVVRPTNRSVADLNADCRVNAADLMILLNRWGQDGVPGDINGDGAIDFRDLLILLAEWDSD